MQMYHTGAVCQCRVHVLCVATSGVASRLAFLHVRSNKLAAMQMRGGRSASHVVVWRFHRERDRKKREKGDREGRAVKSSSWAHTYS